MRDSERLDWLERRIIEGHAGTTNALIVAWWSGPTERPDGFDIEFGVHSMSEAPPDEFPTIREMIDHYMEEERAEIPA